MMKEVDLRPTTALTRDELLSKINKLQRENERLRKLSKRTVVSEDAMIMQYTIVNLRKQLDDLVNNVVNRDIVRARLMKEENRIVDFICKMFNVNELELSNDKHDRKFLIARCAYYYVARRLGYTYEATGKRINKHHVTVLHGSKLYHKYLTDSDIQKLDNFIKNF